MTPIMDWLGKDTHIDIEGGSLFEGSSYYFPHPLNDPVLHSREYIFSRTTYFYEGLQ